MQSIVVLSIGSNCGDRRGNVLASMEWLSSLKEVVITRKSDIYETPELYGKGSPYINAVMEIRTGLSYDELQQSCKDYEVSAGRDAMCRSKGLVPIDIDIVIWNEEVFRHKDFTCSFFRIGYDNLSLVCVKSEPGSTSV